MCSKTLRISLKDYHFIIMSCPKDYFQSNHNPLLVVFPQASLYVSTLIVELWHQQISILANHTKQQSQILRQLKEDMPTSEVLGCCYDSDVNSLHILDFRQTQSKLVISVSHICVRLDLLWMGLFCQLLSTSQRWLPYTIPALYGKGSHF